MKNFLISIFGVNFRTAMIGYAGAIFVACLPLIQNQTFDIHKDWKNLVIAAGIALFGSKSKDAAVTGTPEQNKPQP